MGVAAVAAALSIFRAANAPAAPTRGLPLADAADPSTRFRLSRVPAPLVLVVLAGWVSLGAILLRRP